MRLIQLLSGITLVAILSSCAVNKQIEANSKMGRVAFQQEDYAVALSQFEEVISYHKVKGKSTPYSIFSMAGISALHVGKNDVARSYLEKIAYTKPADARTIEALAQVYRNIDNLSLEMKTLALFLAKFPNDKNVSGVRSRLFQLYVESENWAKGNATYEVLSEKEKETIPNLEGYLKIQQALDNEDRAEETAEKILSVEKENIIALEYLAYKFYTQAEDLYQREMNAYERKRSNSQYNVLRKSLKLVSEDFKKSRDYYETLFNIDGKAKYAKYLGNIYVRLNNKTKAEFYRKLGDMMKE